MRSRENIIVACYGAAAWVWQFLVLAGMLMGASVALRGGGLALAAVAAVAWVALPLWRWLASLKKSAGSGRWQTLAWRIAALAAVISIALFFPWHRTVSSPGVVGFTAKENVRAECPGFVEKELVRDGDLVDAGQLLVELTNAEVASELARARLELAQQELRARLAYTRQDVATFQAEEVKAAGLRAAIAQRESYFATRLIRAPFAGRVTARHLGERRGSFLQTGEEVLRIGRADGSDVKLAVSQEDEPHFREALNEPLAIRIEGRGTVLTGKLIRVEARATRELIEPALTAIAGGPIALRRAEDSEADDPRHRVEYELAEPHFSATAHIAADAALLPGELARIRFRSPLVVNLWTELQSTVARWLKRYTTRYT